VNKLIVDDLYNNVVEKVCIDIRNEIPNQNLCFSDHKLSTLSQGLSQVHVAGIYLSRELG